MHNTYITPIFVIRKKSNKCYEIEKTRRTFDIGPAPGGFFCSVCRALSEEGALTALPYNLV